MPCCSQERDQASLTQAAGSTSAPFSDPPLTREIDILPEMASPMSPPKQSMPGDSARLSYMSA